MFKYLFIYLVSINLVYAADYRVVKIPEIPLAQDVYPDYERIVAIGDVHGDYKKAKEALLRTGAFKTINHQWQWIGRNTKVIQLGDQLNRGPDGKKILELFSYLRVLAKQGGGEFIPLIGDHEYEYSFYNFKDAHQNDPFYSTQQVSFKDHELYGSVMKSNVDKYCVTTPRNMCYAFRPGSYHRKILATQKVAVKVGDILFSHSGLMAPISHGSHQRRNPSVQEYNKIMRDWILLENFSTPFAIDLFERLMDSFNYHDNSPLFNKVPNCQLLEQGLRYYNAKVMVIGHFPVSKIKPFCGGKLWLIDVGMSKSVRNNNVQVLEFV
ncbi:MAG: metallophosphoesterase [Bacteriovoracaceae bacterium]